MKVRTSTGSFHFLLRYSDGLRSLVAGYNNHPQKMIQSTSNVESENITIQLGA